MPKKKDSKSASKEWRVVACKNLKQLNIVSNAGYPLCGCSVREFNMTPFNFVCQVCNIYEENSRGITHEDMYKADDAPEFVYDLDSIAAGKIGGAGDDELDDDEEEDEYEEEYDEDDESPRGGKKKKGTKKKKEVEEEEEEEEAEAEEEPEAEEEEEEEEEEEAEAEEEAEEEIGPIIGMDEEEEEAEEELDYEDETEEGLGKKHGILADEEEESEEDEELEEELDEEGEDFGDEDLGDEEGDEEGGGGLEDDDGGDLGGGASDVDFEAEVIAKIRKSGDKEICPFCQKSKGAVLRHLSKCKRAPPHIIAALQTYKKQKKTTAKRSKGEKAPADEEGDEDIADDDE